MPIEIKELHIKAIVANSSKEKTKQLDIDVARLKKDLVKQCVQEVMEKLKEKNER